VAASTNTDFAMVKTSIANGLNRADLVVCLEQVVKNPRIEQLIGNGNAEGG